MLPGLLLVLAMIFAALFEWTGWMPAAPVSGICTLIYLIWSIPKLSITRLAFIAVGSALAVLAYTTRNDWPDILWHGMTQANFICGFFVALATLRVPAMISGGIRNAGRYIATQPPGRRYLALSTGGHLFALVLNYGSIQLLGSMVERLMGEEQDETLAKIRNRRMLLAIQRGFLASIIWSPLAFAMVMTTQFVSGSTWAEIVPYALLHMVIFTVVGWALDTIFKPKIPGGPPERKPPQGTWWSLLPLIVLLAVTLGGVGVLELLTGLRVAAVVMVFVPIVALGWLLLERFEHELPHVGPILGKFVREDLPSYRSELVLLVMAGFIGTVGGELARPVLANLGLDLEAMPTLALLLGIMVLIPVLGQLGMNPILSVALLAPILPTPDALGIPAGLLGLAVLSGWVIAGVTSPFTATNLLVGRFGGVSAWRVGLVWSAGFTAAISALFAISIAVLLALLKT